MDPSEAFEQAQVRVKSLKKTPGPAQLLELYALFKQGSLGDVSGARPGMLDVKGRAKYDAWAKKRGQSSSEAQLAYVRLVDQLLAAQSD
ncbi:MAG TPA: acyl-CoA-binding protein [Polyangiaceae bacterium]|nr:acyl-CoA-binding protein [Polyangiaceae bacterium]